MSDLDVEKLLNAHSEDQPSGEDLEYDPEFIEMESAAQGKPEQQYGDTIIPAEPPDWKAVENHAKSVVERSHDLRAAIQLANAKLVQSGMVAFADVMDFIRGMVVDHWATFHPQLDPDDDNDPTIRVNTLMSLCDNGTTLDFLAHASLVQVRAIGQFGLFDWRVAHGDIPWPEDSDQPKPEMKLIQAAFQDCDLDELKQTCEAAQRTVESVKAIENFVTDQVGAAQSCNFEKLHKDLKAIQHLVDEQLGKRSPVEPDPVAEPENSEEAPAEGGSESGSQPAAARTESRGFNNINDLVVKTRQEAIVALDKICEYFERYEPSSPLPLLLHRARRLSNKSFLEIIRDISPDGIHQVESLGGLDDNSPSVSGSYDSVEDHSSDYGSDYSQPSDDSDTY